MTPAPSTPVEGTGEQRCVHCGQSPDDPGASMCQIDGISTGKLHDFQPGEGDGRPGGWVEGIGWVALLCDLAPGDVWAPHLPPAQPTHVVGMRHNGTMGASVPFSPSVVIITRWADGTTPAPPASPADDVPDADAVAFQNGYQIGVRVGSEHHGPCRGLPPASPVPPTRPANYDHTRAAESEAIAKATYALGDHLHPWEDASFDLTESYIGAVCEAMDEFPVPPTPTPCPYIVTGGEGTSHCSLAERSAMHAAAPPSTPADPRPTDLTGSEA